MWRRPNRSYTAVQSQLIDLGVQRAQYEHAIAMLIGKAPAELTIPAEAATDAASAGAGGGSLGAVAAPAGHRRGGAAQWPPRMSRSASPWRRFIPT